MQISTFHSFCADLLRRYPRQADLPNGYQILNEEGQFLFVYSNRKALGLDAILKGQPYAFFSSVIGAFNKPPKSRSIQRIWRIGTRRIWTPTIQRKRSSGSSARRSRKPMPSISAFYRRPACWISPFRRSTPTTCSRKIGTCWKRCEPSTGKSWWTSTRIPTPCRSAFWNCWPGLGGA